MAIQQHIYNMLPLIDGIWLHGGICLPDEITADSEGKRSITLGEPVPIASLPRARRLHATGVVVPAPAFGGEMYFGMLEEDERSYGVCMLLGKDEIPFVASFSQILPFRHGEVHGTHLLLESISGERIRFIVAEDFSTVKAESI